MEKLSASQINDAAKLMADGMAPADAYRLAAMYGDADRPILGWPTVICVMAVAVGICLYFRLF